MVIARRIEKDPDPALIAEFEDLWKRSDPWTQRAIVRMAEQLDYKIDIDVMYEEPTAEQIAEAKAQAKLRKHRKRAEAFIYKNGFRRIPSRGLILRRLTRAEFVKEATASGVPDDTLDWAWANYLRFDHGEDWHYSEDGDEWQRPG